MHRLLTVLLVGVAATSLACGQSRGSSADHIKAGEELVKRNKLAEAVIEYRNAVRADDRNSLARQRLGETLALMGEVGRASEQLVRAADLAPDNAALQLEAAHALLATDNFEDAQARAEAVLKKDPKNVGAHLARAAAAAGLNDVDGSLGSLESAATLDPTRVSTFTNRAAVQLRAGKLPEAEAGFRQAVAVGPKSIDAHLALGSFLWAIGRLPEAEESVKKAVGIDPKSVRANIALATFYRGTNRPAEAEAPLKAAMAAAPDSIDLQLALADYYVLADRQDAAKPILLALAKTKETAAAAGARLAAIEYDSGQPAAGHKRLDDLIKSEPTNAQLMVVKGNWLLRERHFDQALALAQTAVQRDNRLPDAFLLLGNAYRDLNDPEQAEKAYTTLLQLSPNSPAALSGMTLMNLGRGRNDEALTTARQAAAAAPDDGLVRLTLARALYARGDVAAARAELKTASAKLPNNPQAIALAGEIDARTGDTASARRMLTRALEVDPGLASALRSLVQLDLTAKRPADAVRTLEAHLAKSQAPEVLLIAGRTYAATGDLPKAEAVLNKAIDQDASLMEAYHVLGQVYIRQRKLDEAIKAYEQRLTTRPNDVGAQTMVGMILVTQGKVGEAKGRFEKILSIDPRAPVASNNLAYMDAENGANLDIALNRAQTAKAALPDDPDVNDTLGWVYVKRNLPALAVAPLEQAVQKVPTEPTYRYHLGVAHAKAGDKDRARTELQRALSLSTSFDGAADAKNTLDGLGR